MTAVQPNLMNAYYFIRTYRPQFGGTIRNAGRVRVMAASQADALQAVIAAASPTERHNSQWLPSHGCASKFVR